jgi:hypothetical protein
MKPQFVLSKVVVGNLSPNSAKKELFWRMPRYQTFLGKVVQWV